ncbi:MAG: metal ABC transporter ATP-binding protein [Thermococci archaeon]|nr:metal ABC transporter ATP-binding protein [Thermococci archaeon]
MKGDVPAIDVRDLTVYYGGRPAVEGVSFSLERGETLLLLGPNGAGKTTILRVIGGFHREYSGRVLVFGEPPLKAKSLTSYVPQSHSLNERVPLKAFEVVAMGAIYRKGLIHGRIPQTIAEKARSLLEFVGLGDVWRRSFRGLSGGQKQRVLIARALMSDPKLLLLDEPLSALDPSARAEVSAVLGKIKEEKGVTMVITTHDINPLVEIGDRVLLINRRAVAFGRPAEVLTDGVVKSVYGPLARAINVDGRLYCIIGDVHLERR